jgi:hypothetical protein
MFLGSGTRLMGGDGGGLQRCKFLGRMEDGGGHAAATVRDSNDNNDLITLGGSGTRLPGGDGGGQQCHTFLDRWVCYVRVILTLARSLSS